MVFGLLSLLMGHWISFVAEICVKPSALMSSRFYPCAPNKFSQHQVLERHGVVLRSDHFNSSIPRLLLEDPDHDYCPEIYSWRTWENQAKTLALRGLLTAESCAVSEDVGTDGLPIRRLSSFVSHHTSHPWSQNRLLVWLTHQLPFTYDFHNYMLRSMEEELRDIVGIRY